jgi:hypothetical protein
MSQCKDEQTNFWIAFFPNTYQGKITGNDLQPVTLHKQ